ncbi:MAG: alpha-amylase [Salegentibacter sp.]|uniref:Alpha-amylase n=1 Tax=Salegentibacter flavus TaxID=287099 RepID=A0A1I5CY45_9FLAO|nr:MULTISPECIES: alpha-amylase [Salegentibacter]MDR9457744.1 alpha-amylase [Salegentibacter sp.]SFN91551.1 alpha-amylase [Salegentibacter flavus]
MKKIKLILPVFLGLVLSFSSCSKDDDEIVDPGDDNSGEIPVEPNEPELLELRNYSSGQKVMMQTFYWDVEPRHEWWTTLSDKVEGWADAGIDRLWFPVATKGQSGGYSMGYDPSDYFDFGEYYQQQTTPTRFGTRTELEALIEKSHNLGLEVIADIVINHNSGGGKEYNPYRDKDTWTLFNEENGNASGWFNRNYENFYPNSTSPYDDGSLFYEETNLDHNQEYVQDWLWKKENSVAKYYMNEMGFDGWRFDYVAGFEPWVVKAWLDEVGGFSVAELWDGNASNLANYVEETGSGAFDFATFYKLDEAFDRHDDLTFLERDMLWKTHPDKAVTFTANHDTEKDDNEDNNISVENKMKAYAFILTHPGYPTIFYSDYENENFQAEIQQLIEIHNSLAVGDIEILHVDKDEYIMKRNGNNENPGLIIYISTGENTKRRNVQTNWKNVTLLDYSGNSTYIPTSDENGTASLEAPANGYAIWSVSK